MTQSKILMDQNQEEKENANVKWLALEDGFTLLSGKHSILPRARQHLQTVHNKLSLELSVKTNKWLARKGTWL